MILGREMDDVGVGRWGLIGGHVGDGEGYYLERETL